MKEIWFIRHAESEANAGLPGRHPALIPLTEKGYQQSLKLSTVIPTIPSLVVFSPYLRTQQTARLTLQLFPQVQCQEWNIQEFTYLSPALCQDTTLRQRRPMAEEYWKRNDPFYTHGDGAESFAAFHSRVLETYQRIETIERGLTLIFGHGQFMRLLLLRLLLGSVEPDARLMGQFALFNQLYEIPNCGILKMRFQAGEPFVSGLITDHLRD